MRFLLATACAACAFSAWAEDGAARQAQCLLIVQGTELIRGPCTFAPLGTDGSFTATGLNGRFFAYVLVDSPGQATGYWNGKAYATHAHEPLGTLTRDDACWVNDIASVCAW
jgi:hypothetical protein